MTGPTAACHADTIELCIVLHGRCHSVVDGRSHHIGPNEVGVVPPGLEHSSWTQAEGVDELIVHLDHRCVGPDTSVPADVFPAEALGLDRLIAANDPAEREAAALQMLKGVIRHPSRARTHDPRLERMCSTVRADLSASWTVPKMAALAGMSPRTLRRSMHNALGISPQAWLLRARVDAATPMLTSTSLPVSDIAYRVGFRSPSRLSEAFKQAVGLSPSVWRSKLSNG